MAVAAVELDSSGRAVQPAPAAAGRAGGSTEPGLGKRLMTVLRAVYHMLRRGRKRLTMDARLLLGRGNKLAGKALHDLLAAAAHHHHHQHQHQMVEPSTSHAAAPASSSGLSFVPPYGTGDVEFSCTTTPSYSFGFGAGAGAAAHPGTGRALFPFRIRRRGAAARASGGGGAGLVDFVEVARELQMLQAADAAAGSDSDHQALSPSSGAWATPSPMLGLSLGRSPAGVRRLRVTDSPFPLDPPEGLARSDSSFEAFISSFHENLRKQPAEAATPDNRRD
ncbi:hypothetical protein ZEAMMB73_Zm00001d039412 [Zea mays]|uniref:Avr9/Cf-9 rapidly elicited protein 146 n=1 Tax=Zea mays TaxID=4577 RepID=A0A1D6MGC9_MAIZE|nr:hypothetical protein ZEAMMB73_Zm00001d039412 [Zea mays]